MNNETQCKEKLEIFLEERLSNLGNALIGFADGGGEYGGIEYNRTLDENLDEDEIEFLSRWIEDLVKEALELKEIR